MLHTRDFVWKENNGNVTAAAAAAEEETRQRRQHVNTLIVLTAFSVWVESDEWRHVIG